MKLLKYCDWNYKESAKNFENVTKIELVMEKGCKTFPDRKALKKENKKLIF